MMMMMILLLLFSGKKEINSIQYFLILKFVLVICVNDYSIEIFKNNI
jgi:hypothetical protein